MIIILLLILKITNKNTNNIIYNWNVHFTINHDFLLYYIYGPAQFCKSKTF